MPNDLLSAALRYAELGFWIFPLHSIRPDGKCACSKPNCTSPGKHPRIKWKDGATCDPGAVRGLWTRWPNAGIGLACGPSGLLVSDLDGPVGRAAFEALGLGPIVTAVSRTARGAHVFFRGDGGTRSDPVTKLDTRGVGGYVVLPPSPHASGVTYEWIVPPERGIAAAPEALVAYSRKGRSRGTPGAPRRQVVSSDARSGSETGQVIVPSYLVTSSAIGEITGRLGAVLDAPDWPEVVAALTHIPPDCSMEEWLRVGMALHQSTNGSAQAFDMWDAWSRFGGDKYKGREELEYKWSTFRIRPDGVGLGSLFDLAIRRGYHRATTREEVVPPAQHNNQSTTETRPPPDTLAGAVPLEGMNGHAQDKFFEQFNEDTTNPLIKLNNRFSVLANHGGKCVVLEWVKSNINPNLKIPSMQTFAAFRDRYGNEYVTVTKTKHLKDGDQEYEEAVQLGAHWLKWPSRRTYQGLELNPGGPPLSEDGYLNIWRGWGCDVRKGDWKLMRAHIIDVLAAGDPEAADYILRWAAWTVQNPAKPAEVALVLRGDKGAGKGLFAGALKRIFGAHGLQIYSSKHLVGNFNAHMRACLLLFADEAYWAGDKASESVLKGLITEPTYPVEQKGVDTVDWPNRLHIIMSANDDWVVPASHDERRYAVFDVSPTMVGDHLYFQALQNEIKGGGLEAMLYDLLQMELGLWHPRTIPQNEALRLQKMQSMQPTWEWWESIAQDGFVPRSIVNERTASSKDLLEHFREAYPRARINPTSLGRFLKNRGCTKLPKGTGNYWEFPDTQAMRDDFERKWGKWEW